MDLDEWRTKRPQIYTLANYYPIDPQSNVYPIGNLGILVIIDFWYFTYTYLVKMPPCHGTG